MERLQDRVSRRIFFKSNLNFLRDVSVAATTTAILASACAAQGEQEPILVPKEQEDTPQQGDILRVGREAFLLKNNKFYRIPDLEKYKRNTKLDEYGRRIFDVGIDAIEKSRLLVPEREVVVKDPFTGSEKRNKPFGGELNVFFPGFMTDGGVPYDYIRHDQETFLFLRSILSKNGFDNKDSLFFTWGEKGKLSYPARNTTRPLEENEAHALDFFVTLKELFPLAQFNIFAHSLGTLMAFAVAKKHSDAINNLVFFDGPIRGLNPNDIRRRGEIQTLRWALKRFFDIEEEVTEELFRRFKDKNYQREADEFGVRFVAKKRGFINNFNENDGIVTPESAAIRGAKEYRIPRTEKVISWRDYLPEHGRNLRTKEVLERVAQAIGEDFADAA